MQNEPSNVPSPDEIRCVALGIGSAIGPVETIGMVLRREGDLKLRAEELGHLTVLAKEAHACAEELHRYASTIEEEIGRGAWLA
jgi:hypothetical protein